MMRQIVHVGAQRDQSEGEGLREAERANAGFTFTQMNRT